MSKHSDDEIIDKFARVIVRTLDYIKITEGATEKARSYGHLFVHGKFYGGKLGTLLCKRVFREKSLFKAHEQLKELCPRCRDQLRKLALALIEMKQSRLWEIAGGESVGQLSQEQMLALLVRLREMNEKKEKAPTGEQAPMFESDELDVSVRMTSVCTDPRFPLPPAPSSTSANLSPFR